MINSRNYYSDVNQIHVERIRSMDVGAVCIRVTPSEYLKALFKGLASLYTCFVCTCITIT